MDYVVVAHKEKIMTPKEKTDTIGELVDWLFLAGLSFYVGLLIGALLFGKPHPYVYCV